MTNYSYDLAGRLLKQCALRQNSIPAREAMEEAAARILALEEALKPFAEEAFRYEPPENDDDNRVWDCRLTIGDLRRAAGILERKTNGD